MRKTLVVLSDDLTGEEHPDITTVEFAWGGVNYEIDLAPDNAQQFEEALVPYLTKARKVRAASTLRFPTQLGTPSRSKATKEELREIREWAREAGYAVSERGRIATEIQQAYDDAHTPAKVG